MGKTVDGNGIVVNTQAFHSMLEAVIKTYTEDLVNGTNKPQRGAFRQKMNFICRVEEKEAADDVVA